MLLLTFSLFLLSFFVRLWGFLGWGLDCRNTDFDTELGDYLLHIGSLISVAKEKLPSFWSRVGHATKLVKLTATTPWSQVAIVEVVIAAIARAIASPLVLISTT